MLKYPDTKKPCVIVSGYYRNLATLFIYEYKTAKGT